MVGCVLVKTLFYFLHHDKNSIVTKVPTYAAFYGQFVSYIEMKRFAIEHKLYMEEDLTLLSPIANIRQASQRYYLTLSMSERAQLSQLSPYEAFVFSLEIQPGTQLQEQLNKAVAEKSRLAQRIECIHQSKTYRTGNYLLFIPRKVIRFCKGRLMHRR